MPLDTHRNRVRELDAVRRPDSRPLTGRNRAARCLLNAPAYPTQGSETSTRNAHHAYVLGTPGHHPSRADRYRLGRSTPTAQARRLAGHRRTTDIESIRSTPSSLSLRTPSMARVCRMRPLCPPDTSSGAALTRAITGRHVSATASQPGFRKRSPCCRVCGRYRSLRCAGQRSPSRLWLAWRAPVLRWRRTLAPPDINRW